MPPRNQLTKLATLPASKTPFLVPRNSPIERRLSEYLQNQRPPAPHMSFLLPGLRRGALLATPLILSTPLLVHNFRHAQAIRCDSADPLAKLGDLRNTYARDAQTPVITQSGAPNPKAVRQISMGSILGVIGGLGISVFSKPLAILLGLGIVALQVSYAGKIGGHRCDFECVLQIDGSSEDYEILIHALDDRVERYPHHSLLFPAAPLQVDERTVTGTG